MDTTLQALYEQAVNAFATLRQPLPKRGGSPSPTGHFEACDVCFDPGYDPNNPPPPPEEPDPGIVPAP